MRDTALAGARPTAVKAYAVLLLLSAVFMALLANSESHSGCRRPGVVAVDACQSRSSFDNGGPLNRDPTGRDVV